MKQREEKGETTTVWKVRQPTNRTVSKVLSAQVKSVKMIALCLYESTRSVLCDESVLLFTSPVLYLSSTKPRPRRRPLKKEASLWMNFSIVFTAGSSLITTFPSAENQVVHQLLTLSGRHRELSWLKVLFFDLRFRSLQTDNCAILPHVIHSIWKELPRSTTRHNGNDLPKILACMEIAPRQSFAHKLQRAQCVPPTHGAKYWTRKFQ